MMVIANCQNSLDPITVIESVVPVTVALQIIGCPVEAERLVVDIGLVSRSINVQLRRINRHTEAAILQEISVTRDQDRATIFSEDEGNAQMPSHAHVLYAYTQHPAKGIWQAVVVNA